MHIFYISNLNRCPGEFACAAIYPAQSVTREIAAIAEYGFVLGILMQIQLLSLQLLTLYT